MSRRFEVPDDPAPRVFKPDTPEAIQAKANYHAEMEEYERSRNGGMRRDDISPTRVDMAFTPMKAKEFSNPAPEARLITYRGKYPKVRWFGPVYKGFDGTAGGFGYESRESFMRAYQFWLKTPERWVISAPANPVSLDWSKFDPAGLQPRSKDLHILKK